MNQTTSRYSEAGVDIDKGNLFVSRIKSIVADTHRRGVLTDIGGFSGLFAIGNENLKNPVLIASTDGVGTKLAIAKLCNKHDTIGIDLVAMCANDVIVSGAKPLFFLDYFASSTLDLEVATDVVRGIAAGCKLANCSLIGGETAEMPGLYQPGDYDLAGFVVGIGERDALIDGSDIAVGNRIIGLASSGVHSNGYSLVRKVFVEDPGHSVDDHVESLGCTVGEELCGRPASTSKACSTSCAASGSTAWCTSPAAASSTTSRASCPPAATPTSRSAAGPCRRCSAICRRKATLPPQRCSAPSTWASA